MLSYYCDYAGLYTPDKPTNPRIISINSQSRHSVKLEWTAPETDGGSTISSYVVIFGFPVANRTWYSTVCINSASTNYTLADEQWSGSIHRFAVAARNRVGRGEFSDFSSTFTNKSGNNILTVFAVISYISKKWYICSRATDLIYAKIPSWLYEQNWLQFLFFL